MWFKKPKEFEVIFAYNTRASCTTKDGDLVYISDKCELQRDSIHWSSGLRAKSGYELTMHRLNKKFVLTDDSVWLNTNEIKSVVFEAIGSYRVERYEDRDLIKEEL